MKGVRLAAVKGGNRTDPPADAPTSAYYLGFCDTCRIVETFRTAESRERWYVTRHDHS
jgi:hypothetical protein